MEGWGYLFAGILLSPIFIRLFFTSFLVIVLIIIIAKIINPLLQIYKPEIKLTKNKVIFISACLTIMTISVILITFINVLEDSSYISLLDVYFQFLVILFSTLFNVIILIVIARMNLSLRKRELQVRLLANTVIFLWLITLGRLIKDKIIIFPLIIIAVINLLLRKLELKTRLKANITACLIILIAPILIGSIFGGKNFFSLIINLIMTIYYNLNILNAIIFSVLIGIIINLLLQKRGLKSKLKLNITVCFIIFIIAILIKYIF